MSKLPVPMTLLLSALTAAALGATGCVTDPVRDDNQLHRLGENVIFQGYASRPGATVVLQAYNQKTGTWEETGDEVTASTTPLTVGDLDLYSWRLEHRLRQAGTIEDTWCLFNRECERVIGGGVTYRVREPGGKMPTLFTYDHDDMACTLRRMNEEHEALVKAYMGCAWAPENEEHFKIHVLYTVGLRIGPLEPIRREPFVPLRLR